MSGENGDRKVVTLTEPTQAHGETIRELRLRAPTGNDLWETGFPFRFDAGGEMTINMHAAMGLVARLAGVPLSTIKALSMADVMTVVGMLTNFFPTREGDGEIPSSALSISPTSGADSQPTISPSR